MSRSRSFEWKNYVLSLILAAIAGWTDAVAYVYGRGVYVSFMSGNSTELAVYTIEHQAKVILVGSVIGCFVAGVVLGELIAKHAPKHARPWVLLTEGLLLAAGALLIFFGARSVFTLLALALGLGAQNASVHQAGDISVSVTYVTGTLVRLGRGIAAGLAGEGHWHIPLAYLGLWLALICGAFVGAALSQWTAAGALAGVSLAVLALAAIMRRTAPQAS